MKKREKGVWIKLKGESKKRQSKKMKVETREGFKLNTKKRVVVSNWPGLNLPHEKL